MTDLTTTATQVADKIADTDTVAGFVTGHRAGCACGDVTRVLGVGQVVPLQGKTHAASACLDDPGTDAAYAWDIPGATLAAEAPAPADPVEVFSTLLRELGAADTLVRLSTSDLDKRRAALDGLDLARAALADAAAVLTHECPVGCWI